MIAPTCEQLMSEELDKVLESFKPWRHGTRVKEVFHRESDGTYWQAEYLCSGDGETNELREGDARITQVEPRQVMVTKYVKLLPVPPSQENSDG